MSVHKLANICIGIDGEIPPDSEWNLFLTDEVEDVGTYLLVHRMSEYSFELIGADQERQCILASPDTYIYSLNATMYDMCVHELFQQRVIHLHSSFVLYENKAILFTGPSGIGKTTQAELWRDYQGAEIVNGDVTLIRKWDGRYCAFGAPIHGSSPYCENKSAPIAAVIVLQQGQENRFEYINGYEVLCHCLPEIYRPEMSDETRDILWETMDDFFTEIPVYRFTCHPDRESTELVKRKLDL